MGSLSLPTVGRVNVDTQIVVYTVEKHPTFSPPLRAFWKAVQSGSVHGVTSELLLLEMLVQPLRSDDKEMVRAYEAFAQQPGLALIPISRNILRKGSELRASLPRLRTPDGIHAATAIDQACSLLLTNDSGLRGLGHIDVRVLNDTL